MKRILVVAFADSSHVARWLRPLLHEPWDVHLFPSTIGTRVHPILQSALDAAPQRPHFAVETMRPSSLHAARYVAINKLPAVGGRSGRARWLERVIRQYQPDLVHSLEFQHAGYLCLEVARHMGNAFPAWCATNYGSDIYWYMRFDEHLARIREILQRADFYSAECARDLELARQLGFGGHVMPVIPNAGGVELNALAPLRQEPASSRRLIAVKGYQHFVGRAYLAMEAFEQIADDLKRFDIAVHSATNAVARDFEAFGRRVGLSVTALPLGMPHREMLALHGAARVSIGLSDADGASTSFLEALAMGAFPIQTRTACADEWIVDATSGFIVDPDDASALAGRIRAAVTDDALVDRASLLNAATARKRLERNVVDAQIVDYYRQIEQVLGATT